MNISRRRLWILAGILGWLIILLTLLAAPAHNQPNSGSTYGRSPDGYAGWYAFMKERKIPIQRWQKPFQYLLKKQEKSPITLLRIYGKPNYSLIGEKEMKWIEKGNILVVLSVRSIVTEAPFSTQHKYQSLSRSIKIDTTRREKTAKQVVLGDKFGAIVWEEKRGKGRLIYATTPYLAANAYQNNLGNYEFLAKLIESSQPNQVFIDEYIHGYKDAEVKDAEGERNLLDYLIKTPLVPLFIQGLVILFIAIWAKNRRLGKALILTPTTVNNSKAYVGALAAVLQKAESSEFIIEIVGKEEQLQIQKALGLKGDIPDMQSLIQSWVQQTGQPAIELEKLLRLPSQKHRLSDSALLDWMKSWQDIHKHFPLN
jgi:hypothetical protein